MATYKIVIKDINATNKSALYLYIRWDANKAPSALKISTGISVKPQNWKNGEVVPKNKVESSQLNTKLDSIILIAKTAFLSFELNEKREPTRKELQELLMRSEKDEKYNFFSYLAYFQKNAHNRLNRHGSPITVKAIENYTKLKNVLTAHVEYSIKTKGFDRVRTDFDTIDMDWYNSFLNYSYDEMGHSTNYTGSIIGLLKVVLNDAKKRGYNHYNGYLDQMFIAPNEEVDSIALDVPELMEIFNAPISPTDPRDIARDHFLTGAWTALRMGDFLALDPNDFVEDYIYTTNEKTLARVAIPINMVVRSIHNKYAGKRPPEMDEKYLNKYIKDICSKLPSFQMPITLWRTVKRKRIKVTKFKWQWVTTHTARRSFATILFLLGESVEDIKAITGHKTDKAFFKYIKIAQKDSAVRIKAALDKINYGVTKDPAVNKVATIKEIEYTSQLKIVV